MQTKKEYIYEYPHAAMTADCVIFGFDGEKLKLLLIERGCEPYKGMWALPGGFMQIDETIEETAKRELMEETGIKGVYMEQFKVYSTVDRDPRERVVTVAFIALVRPEDYLLCAASDASNALWYHVDFLPPLAFDHAVIIKEARSHLSEMLRVRPIAFELLNKYFTMSELQKVYEAITGHSYDRRNFQRKALQSGGIQPLKQIEFNLCKLNRSVLEPESERVSRSVFPDVKSRKKFFSYIGKKEKDDEENDEDGSMKDIFNF